MQEPYIPPTDPAYGTTGMPAVHDISQAPEPGTTAAKPTSLQLFRTHEVVF